MANALTRATEFDYYITPDGKKYRFDNGRDKFLMSFSGHGLPPIEYITQKNPYQHGETLVDFRLQPRIIQMIHRRKGFDRQSYWENRAELVDILRPNRSTFGSLSTGVLRKIRPGNVIRDIDVVIDGNTPEFTAQNPEEYDYYGITETLRFIAYDPTFYDPTLRTETWDLRINDQLQFPFYFNLTFEAGIIDNDKIVNYSGNWDSYPTFVLNGPMTTPIIHNKTTGEKLIINMVVSSGDVVTVYLPIGNKHATSNIYGDVSGALSGDVTTFHLVPQPSSLSNIINVYASGCKLTGAYISSLVMKYYDRYIGI